MLMLPATPGLMEFPLDGGKGTAVGFTVVFFMKHPILKPTEYGSETGICRQAFKNKHISLLRRGSSLELP